jgi:S-(hydroxymethyl)glutathione dehydrogenase/alcohol dehydrogenase
VTVVRAAVISAIGEEKLDLRDDVTTTELAPGDVRIRVKAAGVCHSDLSAMNGTLPTLVPGILGHEAAGDIVEVGTAVNDLAPGDRVVLCWVPPCGSCPACRRGEPFLCTVHVLDAYARPRFKVGDTPAFGIAGCGAFAEEVVMPQQGAIKIPADIPYEIGALIGCGVTTGVGAAINTAQVKPGSSVVVIGCGGVGVAAIQGARLAGASVIVAVDPLASKQESAKQFGATHATNPDGLVDLTAQLTGGEGFDYAFEVVGRAATIRAAWQAARRGGTVTVVGVGSMEEKVEFSAFELLFDGKHLLGSLYGSADVRRDYARLLGLWRSGRLDLEGMISRRLRLDDVNDAIAALKQGEVLRQVILFD